MRGGLPASALCAALSAALACLAATPPEGAPAPPWSGASPPASFSGEALYDHIDGGAEPFLELGFEVCRVRRLTRPGAEVTVEDYAMSDAAAALGIYLMQCGREAPDPSLPERHTVGRTQLLLLKGSHLLRLTGRPDACPPREALVALARDEAAALPQARPPEVLDLLPPGPLRPGTLRLARGPVTLQALAPPFAGDPLGLGPDATAVAADAGEGRSLHTRLAVRFPEAARASRALENLASGLEEGAAVMDRRPTSLAFRDASGRRGTAEVGADGRTLTLCWGLSETP